MNKSAIQKFAIWARTELIAQVSQRAFQYGITAEDYGDANAATVNGQALTPSEQAQRRELVSEIQQKDYHQVMEEVAYTWFNRFIALRFMEVNNYLPSHIRIFSDSAGAFKPEILNDALHLELPGLDREKIAEFIEKNQTEDLYRYLLLTQCNALNEAMPRMFERMGSYTELLLPNNILKADGILGRMVTDIPEEDWTDQVQIIGWLYQYYITEKHDEIVNIYKGTVKREDIPAATQLFTTDWVVRYMVDNSLGRYWIERHPESKLADQLEFFVKPKNGEITHINEPVKPQELTFFDPCMGSGHILVYAFEVLMEIYKECGYGERDAVAEILQNNLFGLDIDERCSQLAYFAVMMKARSYDRRFLSRGIEPQVYYPQKDADLVQFCSLLQVKDPGEKPQEPEELTLFNQNYEVLLNDWNCRRLLSQEYAVVCTNPPYLNKYNNDLKKFVTENYKDYSGDLFSVFISHNFDFCKKDGYSGFMTPFVWMFIKTYEKLREHIIRCKSITSLIQMEYSAFEEATVPICSFVLQNCRSENKSLCFRLSDFKGGMEVQKEKVLEAIANPDCGYFYEAQQSNFSKIPGSPVAYNFSEEVFDIFDHNEKFPEYGTTRLGMTTASNDTFVRLWHEVQTSKCCLDAENAEQVLSLRAKWVPYNKGGAFRRWYGNIDCLVNWENDGYAIKHFGEDKGHIRSTVPNAEYYFRECGTWSKISSGKIAVRYRPIGSIFDVAGACFYPTKEDTLYALIALLNSNVAMKLLSVLSPTMNFEGGHISSLPVRIPASQTNYYKRVDSCIHISKSDWDSYETSWDFKMHPLVLWRTANTETVATLADCYESWKKECNTRFHQLKENEEELNRIFIDSYGLQEELTPEVEDKDVTVHRIFDTKDDVPESMKGSSYVRTKRDEIVALISYAVGCMFGRYSFYNPGLCLAGEKYDEDKFKVMCAYGGSTIANMEGRNPELVYLPDPDNIIPICDDEYFDDDIVGKFVRFVETVYGQDTLEENLQFIADALGGKGTPREVIRSYFLNDFYADHCKIYQKRPIYWLFDSGKKNGFKALIYMHRYQSDLLARMRTDYVHEQQERYRTQLAHLSDALEQASGSERVKLAKQQKKLQEQALEIQKYEEKIHHLADQNISIDLDDGVKHNYELFSDVLAKVK